MSAQKKTAGKPAQKKATQEKSAQPKRSTQKYQKEQAQPQRHTAVFADEYDDAAAKSEEQRPQKPKNTNPDSLVHQFMPIIFFFIALMIGVFLATPEGQSGAIGGFIRVCAYGLFGYGAWLIPTFFIISAILWKKTVQEGKIASLFSFSGASIAVLCALLHAIVIGKTNTELNPIKLFAIVDGRPTVGGVIGGFISNLLMICVDKVVTYIILIFCSVIFLMFTFRLSPRTVRLYLKYKSIRAKEKARERKEERDREYSRKLAEYERLERENEQREKEARRREQRIAESESRAQQSARPTQPTQKKRQIILPDEDMPDGDEYDDEFDDFDESFGSEPAEDENYIDDYIDDYITDTDSEDAIEDGYDEQEEQEEQEEQPLVNVPINMYASNETRKTHVRRSAPQQEDDGYDTLDPIIEDKGGASAIDDIDLRSVMISPEQADELPEPNVDDDDVEAVLAERRGADRYPFEIQYDSRSGQYGASSTLVGEAAEFDEEQLDLPFDLVDEDDGQSVEDSITLEPEMLETTSEEVFSEFEEDDMPPSPPAPKKVYRFPPVSLLAKAAPVNDSGAQEELTQNARKLVETLLSFKVKTKIVSVSRGPTITRYELAPEAGTRVRSIANLVDDIALNLATSGVRIEAPIPGKSAVGIEVPNQVVATVRLRELIDTDAFDNAESRINVALGVDVAGSPVYCNLAKMPHMLIAGATGMGKSVCINSIISSILYKANPDEVKLILVDPKKVEFNIYNGLPHLLVPVVSDPQKAAGALNWAVGEMERRFSLIDEVGVRDIGGYNAATKNDPDREHMPYVVIIIDELADLMMTAKDTVETSICRLAQKARAAGMHLVIGTQRPSVDVITGLIKANIPSRIAFTVASQVDSKTIIDIGGAEKLIGRGDMLYAPVGLMKPLRVQGAFVSDEEVRAITDFIRSEGGFIEYDPEIICSIEREAERCAQTGKGGAAELDEDELREFLAKAKPHGLDAIETHYSTYDEETTRLAEKIAKEFDIKQSGGSDFHGYRKPDISLGVGRGELFVPAEFAENLFTCK